MERNSVPKMRNFSPALRVRNSIFGSIVIHCPAHLLSPSIVEHLITVSHSNKALVKGQFAQLLNLPSTIILFCALFERISECLWGREAFSISRRERTTITQAEDVLKLNYVLAEERGKSRGARWGEREGMSGWCS